MNMRWAKRLHRVADLDRARTEGFECIQLPVDAVMDWDDAAFPRERERMLASGMSFDVFESPLPKAVQVTERGFNIYSWAEYVKTVVYRVSELGCTALVWGDGRARRLPIEGEVSTLKENFYQFMFMLCEICERYDITVCLEPLGAGRTNFLNTLQETMDCFSLIGKRNLAMMVSLRDLVEMKADPTDVSIYKDSIAHIHLEHPITSDKSVPPRLSDGYDYMPFFRALREMNYTRVLSLPPDSEADDLSYCRSLWEKSKNH